MLKKFNVNSLCYKNKSQPVLPMPSGGPLISPAYAAGEVRRLDSQKSRSRQTESLFNQHCLRRAHK